MSVVILRDAHAGDADYVFDMLKLLAVEVGEPDEFDSTVEDVHRDAFGPKPRYDTVIAEVNGRRAGIATHFFTYSTYKGKRCLYVNDLVVEEWARGGSHAIGRRLMAHMAAIALDTDCCRLDLRVHTHNEARGFYRRIGMFQSDDLPYILRGDALADLAAQARSK